MSRIKTVGIVIVIIGLMLSCTACAWNYQWFDLTYEFDRAIIRLVDGTVVDGRCEQWRDFEDGDQIQVTVDGSTYLVHSCNVTLIAE